MSRSLLVSGAGIAGPALALSLAQTDWDVTVVERSAHPRQGGQSVDVRGVGRTVARRLGLEDLIAAQNTTETGTEIMNPDGSVAAHFSGTGDESPTAELEILRGALSELLHQQSASSASYRFGEEITSLGDRGERVEATFGSGERRQFDVAVIADGQRSELRGSLFPDAELHRLGVDIAYLTIRREPSDTDTWQALIVPGGRQVSVRPDNVGTIRATLAFRTGDATIATRSRAEQVEMLRQKFGDVGWKTDRILAALDEGDMFYESLAQVHAPRWGNGRVALLGDAAHCATPLAGFGTSLALAGAYVLAGELATQPDPRRAIQNYEQHLRSFVHDKQKLPPGMPRLAYPTTRAATTMLRLAARAAASPLGRKAFSLTPSNQNDLELPNYRVLHR